jgi:hypothetical protein
MSEWQPIKTAPRDDTSILVWPGPRVDLCQVVHWMDEGACSGWFNGNFLYDEDEFTHWMPLPEPPAQ